MLPSSPKDDPLGSRDDFSSASSQREARGHTSLHSTKMDMARWSISGPILEMAGSGQTVGCMLIALLYQGRKHMVNNPLLGYLTRYAEKRPQLYTQNDYEGTPLAKISTTLGFREADK